MIQCGWYHAEMRHRDRAYALAGMTLTVAAMSCTALLGVDGDYRLEASAGLDGSKTTVADGTTSGVSDDGPAIGADAPATADTGAGSDAPHAADTGLEDAGFPADPGVVTEVTAGYFHACVRFASGFAMCWGRNEDFGELGNGTTLSTGVPEPAMGAGLKQLIAGAHDTCGILVDGGGECAGKGGLGELGDGVFDADVPYPVPMSVLPAAPITLASGTDFTCVVVADGNVYCVGDGSTGQLGNGGTEVSTAAVQVSLQGKQATAVAALNLHACALLVDGTVSCWGVDTSGQLGDGNPIDDAGSSATPLAVQGLPGAASAICAGNDFSCAVVGNDANSTVWCWGDNTFGQLGNDDPTVPASSTAVQVIGAADTPLTGAVSITCGAAHACIGNDYAGNISCWGANGSGQLGNGSTGEKNFTASLVSGVTEFPESLSAGGFFTCAMFASPNVVCWGDNGFGQLGNGGADQGELTPTPVTGIP
jgi:alpha-tubulin suppressor-like RCC1 family protein